MQESTKKNKNQEQKMSFIYIKTEPQLWTTGHYDPDGRFHPDDDFGSPDEAADRCAYLNGDASVDLDEVKDLIKALKKEVKEIRQCRSLSQDFGGPKNLYPRKECATPGCTREAPQDHSHLCGKCRKEKKARRSE
jgi:hypothetical protein